MEYVFGKYNCGHVRMDVRGYIIDALGELPSFEAMNEAIEILMHVHHPCCLHTMMTMPLCRWITTPSSTTFTFLQSGHSESLCWRNNGRSHGLQQVYVSYPGSGIAP